MYVEGTIASTTNVKDQMDLEVNQATAALKGMLGLGSGTEMTPDICVGKLVGENGAEEADKGKKKNSRKKKNKNATPSRNERAADTSNKKATKGKAQKKPAKTKENENYAWSAFQSSPDASKLPIPAFSSPVQPKKPINLTVQEAEGLVIAAETSESPHTHSHLDKVVAVSEVTGKVVVMGRGAEAEATSATTTTTSQPETSDDSHDYAGPSLAPVSKTGINLAALTLTLPGSSHQPREPELEEDPSIPMTFQHHQQPPFLQNQFQTPLHMPPYPNSQYYHHPHGPPVFAGMMSPPGFITIQVQVPAILMPGRQMVVTSPAGYPVQVTVPEHVPPGALLPVHVPVGPPHHLPYPSHMQPLPPRNQY